MSGGRSADGAIQNEKRGEIRYVAVAISCAFVYDIWETAVHRAESGMEHYKNSGFCGAVSPGAGDAGNCRADVCGASGADYYGCGSSAVGKTVTGAERRINGQKAGL